jgi:Carboxypeptidase regulatory-like domain
MKRAVAIALVGAFATAVVSAAGASDLSGRIVFNDAAVPGATVTATRGGHTVSTVTDEQGAFHFSGLEDGVWGVSVEMIGFVPVTLDVTVPPSAPISLTLTLRPYEDMVADLVPGVAEPVAAGAEPAGSDTDPDVINGSSINGAASVYAQARAFGNNRPAMRALYTGAVNAVLGNAAWNARPYSFSGSTAPTPSYGDAQLGFTLGGPLKIPWLVSYGPQTVVAYQHNVSHDAVTQSAVMPTAAERAGDFSQAAGVIVDPLTGQPFADNRVPAPRISPQAAALLALYPLPTSAAGDGANYQRPVVSATTSDRLQVQMTDRLSPRNTVAGTFAFERTLTDSRNLFDFTDRNRQLSIRAGLTWTRGLSSRFQLRMHYQLARAGTTLTPFFAGRTDISGDAGIAGNSSAPVDWGPPTLTFPGIAGLGDAQYRRSTTLQHAGGGEASLRSGRHNLTFGGDVRWDHDDVSSQPNPRGTLSFTGEVTGNAFADFLLGLPTTSAIAFGNTDARLRGSTYDAYLTDDVRVSPGLTLNVGLRWEYEAPFTEASGHLVNLDVAAGFAAVAPVLASSPAGPLTGTAYATSLVRPDKRGVEPRLAVSWRPMLARSLVVRASYGLYRNLGVYEPLALLLAQQPPFSKTLSVQSTPQAPLTLANPFPAALSGTSTFAVDPDFRPGGVQQWQVSVQQDLPASLTLLVSYDGARGDHLTQAFLPNTYPAGAVNPCPACPSGFVFVTSNGSSLRNSVGFTLRRRLHAGLTASVQYTLSKSTDDAATFSSQSVAPGSLAIAQNWLDLGAERGPSSFDRRHVVSAQVQYTTGQGVGGGTLRDGAWGTLFTDWTITSQFTYGSGLPLTPVLFAAVPGTGVVGVRPSLTGASTSPVASGAYANAAAYTAPAPGTWGDAGRGSIRGPDEFSLDAAVARVFRLRGRLNLECRVSATNVINRVTFSQIGTVVTSPQFGLPTAANPMRRLTLTLRLGF